MDSQVLVLVLVGLLLIGCIYLIFRLNGPRNVPQQRPGNTPKSGEALDTLTSWSPEPSRILTAQERVAFNTLRQALPEHMLLAQVPLARFLRVPTRNSYHEWLRRVGQLCADIVVCDSHSMVLSVVEVRAPLGKESDRALRRHERMDKVLRAAGISVIVWREGAIPSAESARRAILGEDAAPAEHGGTAPVYPGGFNLPASRPLSGATAASKPESIFADDLDSMDVIEHREPPPSTWFDELDSEPLPLDQKA